MTLFLPLKAEPPPPLPASPSFLLPSPDPAAHLSAAIQAILKAKRIVVICGAGISVQAGIPDFRSADGLFQSIKRENPKEAMSSGKELFDVSVFNSEQKTALFCQMIAQLSDLSEAAEPTSFHHVLRALDVSGKLLRVYTQNIDAIEQKSGLSFGVPEYERRKSKSKPKKSQTSSEALMHDPANPDHDNNADDNNNDNNARATTSTRLLTPPSETETPRCIPLHGTLQSMHCQICSHTSPLAPFLASLTSGIPPPCPSCTALEATRQLVGKRPRGIGRLRPSVVLYNEAHRDGEGVGEVVSRDLMGSKRRGKGRSAGADLLLVVGTSLRVPGTKRMVREFAKAVRSRAGTRDEQGASASGGNAKNSSGSGLATPAPSPRRSPAADEEASSTHAQATGKSIKSVYLNLDFPVPTREWEGVFDAWIQGDAQEFAEVLAKEIGLERERKEGVEERKREKEKKREKEMQEQGEAEGEKVKKSAVAATAIATPTSVKRKNAVPTTPTTPSPSSSLGSGSGSGSGSGKRRKPLVVFPISPPRTPLVRGRGVGVLSGAAVGAGTSAGARAGSFSGSGSAFDSSNAKPLGMADKEDDETEDDESDNKRSRTPAPVSISAFATLTPSPALLRKANSKGKEKAVEKGKGNRRGRDLGESSSGTSSSPSKLYVLIPARSRRMCVEPGVVEEGEQGGGGKLAHEENAMDQDQDKDIKPKTRKKTKTKKNAHFVSDLSVSRAGNGESHKQTGASPVYAKPWSYECIGSSSSSSSSSSSYPTQPYPTYQYQPYQFRYQDYNCYQGQYQHYHQHQQHQHQYQRPRHSMSSQVAGMEVDVNDVVDMDVDMDPGVNGRLDMDVDAEAKFSDKIEYEEEDVEVEVDIMNDWHYYDDVQYAPSLRYCQTFGRRSASPLQARARTSTWRERSRDRERQPTAIHVGAGLGSRSSSGSGSGSGSSSPSAAFASSRIHAPLPTQLSPRLALHPSLSLPPPPPPPLSSTTTTTQLTERDRLGGRIKHSQTHLSSHMARTLRSGRV